VAVALEQRHMAGQKMILEFFHNIGQTVVLGIQVRVIDLFNVAQAVSTGAVSPPRFQAESRYSDPRGPPGRVISNF
jgi:hypothetical protein